MGNLKGVRARIEKSLWHRFGERGGKNKFSIIKGCDEDHEVSEDKIKIQSANFCCRT